MFYVVVKTDVRDGGTTFGSFKRRDDAEKCVIALAGREDVKSAMIIEE